MTEPDHCPKCSRTEIEYARHPWTCKNHWHSRSVEVTGADIPEYNDDATDWTPRKRRLAGGPFCRPKCQTCGRPYEVHSLNTRDICNFYLEPSDDVQRAVPNREGDAGGTGQGGVVPRDDASQEDLRGFTQCGWRWRVKGHWRGKAWVLTETLPQFEEDAEVEVEPLYSHPHCP